MSKMAGVRFQTDLQAALTCSRTTGRPVLLMFTGYAVGPSLEFSWAVLRDEKVKRIIDDQLILCALMVDDKEALDAKDLKGFPKLDGAPTTRGQRNQMLQRAYFNSQIQPLYVLVDSECKPLTTPHEYVAPKEAGAFAAWLDDAIRDDR